MLIVVPVITVGLWWLLGHTAFGGRGTGLGDERRPRPHDRHQPEARVHRWCGRSRAVLATVAVLLTASDQGSIDLIHIGPTRCAACMSRRPSSAAWSRSRPRRTRGDPHRHLRPRPVLQLHDQTGLVQFLLFIVVLVLVAPRSAGGTPRPRARASFCPRRVAAVPERLQSIWWVRRMPRLLAGFALIVALIVPLLSDESARHQTWTVILAFALMRGVGRRADGLGWSALTRADGVRGSRRADRRGPVTGMSRTSAGTTPASSTVRSLPSRSRGRSSSARSVRASSRCSSASGRSAYAACCSPSARSRSRSRRRSTCSTVRSSRAGRSTVQIPGADIGPLELTHNAAYYYFVLFVLVVVLLLVGHLRRTGVGAHDRRARERRARGGRDDRVGQPRTKLTASRARASRASVVSCSAR